MAQAARYANVKRWQSEHCWWTGGTWRAKQCLIGQARRVYEIMHRELMFQNDRRLIRMMARDWQRLVSGADSIGTQATHSIEATGPSTREQGT